MTTAQMNTSVRRRLIAALLISGFLPMLGMGCESESGQRVSDTFKYPQSQETIRVDAEIRSRSLSGVVVDPSGSKAPKVLVERVAPGWGKRITAVLTDSKGQFAFARTIPGTYFLRFSKSGFNTMLLKVKVSPKLGSKLLVELKLSH